LWARHGFINATRGVIDMVAGAFSDLQEIPAAVERLRREAKRRGAWRLQAAVVDGNEIAAILLENGFVREGRKKDAFRIETEYRDATLLGELLATTGVGVSVEGAPCAPEQRRAEAIQIVRAHPDHAAAYMEFDTAVRLETPYLMRTVAETPSSPAEYAARLRTLTDSTCALWLALASDGRVAGAIAGMSPFGPGAEDDVAIWIAVGQAYWRQGIGQGLLDALTDWGRGMGRRRLTAEVVSTNGRALAFYVRHGFEIEAVRPGAAILNSSYLDEVVLGRIL
jgi:RimJ/RimL family protein N-acetyltransferase